MNKYHLSVRVLHWLTAFFVIGMLILGFLMDNKLLYNIHKAVGIALIFIVALRVFMRLTTAVPNFPSSISKRDAILAKAGHFALYVLIVAMPLSGWFMIDFGSNIIKVFDVELISLVEQNKDVRKLLYKIHEYAPFALIAFIVIHILAFVKHKIVDKVNLIERIL